MAVIKDDTMLPDTMGEMDFVPKEMGDFSSRIPYFPLKFVISYILCSCKKGMHLTVDVKRNLSAARIAAFYDRPVDPARAQPSSTLSATSVALWDLVAPGSNDSYLMLPPS